jgi:preprotein translocase SecE subunit
MKQKIEQLKLFVSEVSQEIRRISWPTPREIAGATGVVLFATAILAVLLMVYDSAISAGLRAVLR